METFRLGSQCCNDQICRQIMHYTEEECEFTKVLYNLMYHTHNNIIHYSCGITEIPIMHDNGNIVCHPQIENAHGVDWLQLFMGCIFFALLTCFINFLLNKRKRF